MQKLFIKQDKLVVLKVLDNKNLETLLVTAKSYKVSEFIVLLVFKFSDSSSH